MSLAVSAVFSACILAIVGVMHSVLGERLVVGPLLADRRWQLAMPRASAERLLRGAWHLTSLAWWGLAAALVGVPAGIVVGSVCLMSAGLLIVAVPGHVAWPLFVASGLLALWTAGALPDWALWLAVALATVVALIAAGFHVAWALGSRRGMTNVLPQQEPGLKGVDDRSATRATGASAREHGTDGSATMFRPGPVVTAGVALALIALAAIMVAVATNANIGGQVGRWMAVIAVVILVARIFGDGKWTGVLKQVRGTGFARADDRYWTPAVGVLALGTVAALVLGA